jgi:hypothetical protein
LHNIILVKVGRNTLVNQTASPHSPITLAVPAFAITSRLAVNVTVMIKYSFVFLILFTIGILSFLQPGLAFSVVPGWHTIILPPWFLASSLQILWLGVASAIYYFIEWKGKAVSQNVFRFHLFSSLFVFLDSAYAFFEDYYIGRIMIIIPYLLFLLGQFVFVIGVFKAKKTI